MTAHDPRKGRKSKMDNNPNTLTNADVDRAIKGKRAVKGDIERSVPPKNTGRTGNATKWIKPEGKPPNAPPADDDAKRLAEQERRRAARRARKRRGTQ